MTTISGVVESQMLSALPHSDSHQRCLMRVLNTRNWFAIHHGKCK